MPEQLKELQDLFDSVVWDEEPEDWEEAEETSDDPDEDEDEEDSEEGEDSAEPLAKADSQLTVKVILHNEAGQTLILRDASSDWWDLPGGHVRDGETPEEGLQREVKEETGLSLGTVQPLYTLDLPLGRTHPVVFYQAEISSPQVTLSREHTKAIWIAPADVEHYNLGVYKDILQSPDVSQGPEASSPLLYSWVDNVLEKAGMAIGGEQPWGAKQVGKSIEQHLYSSLQEAVDEYLASLYGAESQDEVLQGVQAVLKTWEVENGPVADAAFAELFLKGAAAGAVSAGFKGRDIAALRVLQRGDYRIGNRIKLFSEEVVKAWQPIIRSAYTPEGEFDLNYLVRQMNKAVPAQRFQLERIARTETAQISNLGRIWSWEQDPDKYFYKYFWRAVPDNRAKAISKLRASYNPLTFDEAKFLWTHQEQQMPNGAWQSDIFNQRCTISRSPNDAEFKSNRFTEQEHLFRETLAIPF